MLAYNRLGCWLLLIWIHWFNRQWVGIPAKGSYFHDTPWCFQSPQMAVTLSLLDMDDIPVPARYHRDGQREVLSGPKAIRAPWLQNRAPRLPRRQSQQIPAIWNTRVVPTDCQLHQKFKIGKVAHVARMELAKHRSCQPQLHATTNPNCMGGSTYMAADCIV